MKAIRMHSRGGPENLVYEDAPVPAVSRGEILVKVNAAGITPAEFTWSSTFTNSAGMDRLPIIPSFEVSGTVAETAPDLADFQLGDAVYGLLDFWRDGAAAEYAAGSADRFALKPSSVDHVASAAVPLSGLTAWQALFDHAELKEGDRVLIHGAAGGVGTFAVQFAHWWGAHVIGTCSQKNEGFVRELGADEVLDYNLVRFEDQVKDVDVVIDTVGGETLERSWGVVRKDGSLVTIVGDAPEDRAAKVGIRAKSILVRSNRVELNEIARLIDEGEIRPVVEEVFPLSSAREAYERGMLGHNRGKLVLKVVE